MKRRDATLAKETGSNSRSPTGDEYCIENTPFPTPHSCDSGCPPRAILRQRFKSTIQWSHASETNRATREDAIPRTNCLRQRGLNRTAGECPGRSLRRSALSGFGSHVLLQSHRISRSKLWATLVPMSWRSQYSRCPEEHPRIQGLFGFAKRTGTVSMLWGLSPGE